MQKLVDGEEFSISAKDKICYVILNSKSTKNAISFRMAKIMQDICYTEAGNSSLFEKFITNQGCNLIILKSEITGIFSSGGNLIELANSTPESAHLYTSAIKAFCSLLHSTSAISIALLTGPSFGGGAELALATDFRWGIGNSFELHFSQAKFAIPTGWGGMLRLSELCPQLNQRKIAALLLTKSCLSNKQLLQLGLVDQEFKTLKSCQKQIELWQEQMNDCPKYLKEGLFQRQNIYSYDKLDEFDMTFFNKYFLQDEHLQRIQLFLKRKIKNET